MYFATATYRLPMTSLALLIQTAMATIPDIHALSSKQERKLVDYLDEKFLQITGAYRKR